MPYAITAPTISEIGNSSIIDVAQFHLEPHLEAVLADASFDGIFALRGEAVRDVPGRLTQRLEFEDRVFYLKLHSGIGWGEIFKELLSLRLPILGAMNEKRALDALHAQGIATMTVAGYGSRGSSPAAQESFLVTDSLEGTITLEEVTADWPANPPAAKQKHALIKALASAAKRMHAAGINHRDFYLCHFQIDPDWFVSTGSEPVLYLMDLHRAQCRSTTPLRWQIKDIAALYFSAARLGLTRRDWLRFMREYKGDLRTTLKQDEDFWLAVRKRAEKFYRRDWKEAMPVHFESET